MLVRFGTSNVHINIPRNVPSQNGKRGTFTIGAAMLINQFGRNGVILRNRM